MKLQVEYVPIDEIRPYENNAKQHPVEQIEQIIRSINDYGMNDPIAVWKDNVIIEGHGRYMALKKMGYTDVPVIRLDDLTDDQRREYMLVHNKTTMNSGFDISTLEIELAELPSFDAPFYDFEIVTDDGYGTDFSLADGDREPIQQMSFTFSDEEAEIIKRAIDEMKRSLEYQQYDSINENGNGKALYLVVNEWLAQKI